MYICIYIHTYTHTYRSKVRSILMMGLRGSERTDVEIRMRTIHAGHVDLLCNATCQRDEKGQEIVGVVCVGGIVCVYACMCVCVCVYFFVVCNATCQRDEKGQEIICVCAYRSYACVRRDEIV